MGIELQVVLFMYGTVVEVAFLYIKLVWKLKTNIKNRLFNPVLHINACNCWFTTQSSLQIETTPRSPTQVIKTLPEGITFARTSLISSSLSPKFFLDLVTYPLWFKSSVVNQGTFHVNDFGLSLPGTIQSV